MNFQMIDEYLLAMTGCTRDYKEEWGWTRYHVGGKMFAAMCSPRAEHKEYGGHDLLTLKCEPAFSELLRAEYDYVRTGFYMDKRNWISIFLDQEPPEDLVKDLCQRSYGLVFGKLTKKLQKEIVQEAQNQ